ncbi:Fic family protein [Saccharospirillum sp. HFRX-1]|uniref:Fic family protein n=1 Tax=unclassified Saccharospirillum TaxID=2633430 RepID=UPI003723CB98
MRPLGYAYLNEHYALLLPKLGVEVYQDPNTDAEQTINYGGGKRKILPKHRKYSDNPYDQMHVAIKHQGIRLHFFAAMFGKVDRQEFSAFIAKKPTSEYNRVLWFLYEWLTDTRLDIPDLKSGNYVKLFNDEFYYTLNEGVRNKRTRIINNAIGTSDFCPTIRKTANVKALEKIDVYKTAYSKMQGVGDLLSADTIGRSINYLYTKETRSSTEIENEQPGKQRMQRFLNAIKNVGLYELSKQSLLNVQNQIVADNMKASDYRQSDIYVGTTIQRYSMQDEDVHYIGARHEHLESMMNGLFKLHDNLMVDRSVPPLMHATLLSFGEVYIHPFDDGNGRLHRYLIHDVMKHREPDHKFIIPISAAILKNQSKYDAVLEVISRPIMAMLDYHFDESKNLVINNDIDYMYRFPDYTEHVKFVYEMMETAVSDDLMSEICLLMVFDQLKKFLGSQVDLPNSKFDAIVSIVIQNAGTVSKRKRASIEQQLGLELMESLQIMAQQLIGSIKERFGVDVVKMINSPDS